MCVPSKILDIKLVYTNFNVQINATSRKYVFQRLFSLP